MTIKKTYVMNIGIFLLLYYIYLNPLRRFFIPGSSITVAAMLVIVLAIVVCLVGGKISLSHYKSECLLCLSWFLIVVYIVINNENIFSNLLEDGMIQLLVMICVMLFATKYSDWIGIWINVSIFFVLIHAAATMIFYFNSSIYNTYANIMFRGTTLSNVLKYYNRGYMSGLCDHFSTNGMYLGIGLFFFVERIFYCNRTKMKKIYTILYFLGTLITLYALILSSKRSPLLAFIIGIIFVYLVKSSKNIVRNIIILLVAVVTIYFACIWLVPYIPGLDTIANKFLELENSDAGILNGREGLWKIALDMFNSNPFFGQGFGSYAEYSADLDAITTSAHNYYLQVLAELGIVGLVLYLVAFISALVFTIIMLKKCMKSDAENKSEKIMALSISLGIQVFVLIYNLTATALMYYYILIPYFIACTIPRTILHSPRSTYSLKMPERDKLCAQAL